MGAVADPNRCVRDGAPMSVAAKAPAARVAPPRRRARQRARAVALGAARGLGAVLVIVAITLAATGWLDLLRRSGLLRAGPFLHEALPLQRLAGNGAQPLVRVIAAWLPAGLAGGAVLYMLGLRSRLARAAVVFAGCALLLLALGALADAISESDPIGMHVSEQPGRVVIWVAAALAAAGAAVVGRRRAGR